MHGPQMAYTSAAPLSSVEWHQFIAAEDLALGAKLWARWAQWDEKKKRHNEAINLLKGSSQFNDSLFVEFN